MSKSTSLRSEYVHHHDPVDVLSAELAPSNLPSLSLPRIHLLSHIKRVKSLCREESAQRYKELLASTKTWSRFLDFNLI